MKELNRSLFCPNCGKQMSTHLYGGPGNLVVDNCPSCKLLWLDNRELTRVIRAPGSEPSTNQEREDED